MNVTFYTVRDERGNEVHLFKSMVDGTLHVWRYDKRVFTEAQAESACAWANKRMENES